MMIQIHDPLLSGKFGVLTTPLQRIVTGSFLVALAFLMSGFLEIELRKGYPQLPGDGQVKLFIHNGLETGCSVAVPGILAENISSQDTKFVFVSNTPVKNLTLEWCDDQNQHEINVDLSFPLNSKTILVYRDSNQSIQTHESTNPDQIEKNNDDPMPFVR